MKRFLAILFTVVFVTGVVTFAAEPESSVPFDDRAYNEYLIKFLNDPNLGIRFSAATLLGERGVYEAKDELVDMLKNDKAYQNRIAAAIALIGIGDADVLDEIGKQAKKDDCKTVRHVLAGVRVEMQNQRYLTINK